MDHGSQKTAPEEPVELIQMGEVPTMEITSWSNDHRVLKRTQSPETALDETQMSRIQREIANYMLNDYNFPGLDEYVTKYLLRPKINEKIDSYVDQSRSKHQVTLGALYTELDGVFSRIITAVCKTFPDYQQDTAERAKLFNAYKASLYVAISDAASSPARERSSYGI